MKSRIIYFLIICLSLYGCSTHEPKEKPFGLESFSDINNSIQLQVQKEEFFIGEEITLVIINHSKNEIQFPLDCNTILFENQNDQWEPITNEIVLIGDPEFSIPPSLFNIRSVKPNVSGTEESVVRVIVSGKKTLTEEMVAAYIDITLKKK